MAGLKFLRMVGLCCGASLLVSAPVTAWQDDCTELLGGNCTAADSEEAKPAKQKEATVSQVSAPPKASPQVAEKPVTPPKPKPVQVAEVELPPPETRQVSTERKAPADKQPVKTASVSKRTEPLPQETKMAPKVSKSARIAAADPVTPARSAAPKRVEDIPARNEPAIEANARMTGAALDVTKKPSPVKPEQSAPVRFAALVPVKAQPGVQRQVLSPVVPVRSAPQPVMSPTIEMINKPQRVEIQIQAMDQHPIAISEVFHQVERQAESACGTVLGSMPDTHPEWLKCIGAEVEYRVYRSGNAQLVGFFESLLTFNR